VPLPNRPLRHKECTPLCLLLTNLGNPSQWTTCRAFLQPTREITVFSWLWIDFPRWRFWSHARRESQHRPLPISSSNECGYILGYQKPLYLISTNISSSHVFQALGHDWTPSSPNPRPYTPKQMEKLRSST
jgi:hypothetical protein